MSFGSNFKTVTIRVLIILALLKWTVAKTREVYTPESSSRKAENGTFRTQQQIQSLITSLNSTVGGISNKLNSTLSMLPNTITSTISSILSVFTSLLSALGGLFSNKPSLGGIGGSGGESLFEPPQFVLELLEKISIPGTGVKVGNGCQSIDYRLWAWLPGIFVGVPLVMVGMSILCGAIALIVIAMGGFGEKITDKIYSEVDFAGLNGVGQNMDNIEHAASDQYAQQSQFAAAFTQSPIYYGAGSTPANSNAWASHVDSANNDFYKAYDKYSQIQQRQPAQYSEQSNPSSNSNSNSQWNWNTNHVARKKD